MFGYVRPFKPELKINEFDTYKAIYCGLCKTLGREYGQLVRLSLSYDFAFFSTLSLAVCAAPLRFERQTCAAHPFKKRPCLTSCEDLSFAAASAAAMLYYKWKDNLSDSGRIKRFFLRPFGLPVARAWKKAAARYPRLGEIMESTVARQQETEKIPNCSVDRAAEASARALALLFEELSGDGTQKRVLHRFGFLLGRWVYLIDAVDDLSDDRRRGNFNPLLNWERLEAAGEEDPPAAAKRHAEELINVTYAELGLAYELVETRRYRSILDNILYLGLPAVKEQIWSDGRKKRNDRSL